MFRNCLHLLPLPQYFQISESVEPNRNRGRCLSRHPHSLAAGPHWQRAHSHPSGHTLCSFDFNLRCSPAFLQFPRRPPIRAALSFCKVPLRPLRSYLKAALCYFSEQPAPPLIRNQPSGQWRYSLHSAGRVAGADLLSHPSALPSAGPLRYASDGLSLPPRLLLFPTGVSDFFLHHSPQFISFCDFRRGCR